MGCLVSTQHLHGFAVALPWGPIAAPWEPDPPAWGLQPGPPTLTSPHFGCLAAAREQDISFQLLQKLRELIPAVGLTEDMLAVLPKSGECTGSTHGPSAGGVRGGSGHCQWHAHPLLCFPTDQCTKAIR